MRKPSLSLALAVLLMVPLASGAAPASFTGTLTMAIADLATIQMTGSGTGSSGGVGGTATIPANAFTTAFGTPINPPLFGLHPGLVVGSTGLAGHFVAPVPTALQPGGNGALNWTGASGETGFLGSAYLLGFWGPASTCTSGCSAALSVPIALGVVGSGGTSTFITGPWGFPFSLIGNPYQLISTTLTGGFPSDTTQPTPVTLVASAFDNRTASGNGVLQLVSPSAISLGLYGSLPIVSILRLEFSGIAVPEPAMLLLLAAGIAFLATMGRRQRR